MHAVAIAISLDLSSKTGKSTELQYLLGCVPISDNLYTLPLKILRVVLTYNLVPLKMEGAKSPGDEVV